MGAWPAGKAHFASWNASLLPAGEAHRRALPTDKPRFCKSSSDRLALLQKRCRRQHKCTANPADQVLKVPTNASISKQSLHLGIRPYIIEEQTQLAPGILDKGKDLSANHGEALLHEIMVRRHLTPRDVPARCAVREKFVIRPIAVHAQQIAGGNFRRRREMVEIPARSPVPCGCPPGTTNTHPSLL